MSIEKPKKRAKINLTNIGRYIKGYARMFSETFGKLEKYKQEQVIWRADRAKDCVKNKACLYCGCDMPAKLYSDEGCEDPDRKCYPDMMSEAVWKQFKIDNSL